jgi:hypothetical protein
MINLNIVNIIISLDGIDDLPESTLEGFEKYVQRIQVPKKGISKKELIDLLNDLE